MLDDPTNRRIDAEWVGYLQQLLQRAGWWHGEIDSIFSSDLQKVLASFQREMHLDPADGSPRGSTWLALSGAADDPARRRVIVDWSNFPEVRALGSALDFDEYLRNVVGIDPATLKPAPETGR